MPRRRKISFFFSRVRWPARAEVGREVRAVWAGLRASAGCDDDGRQRAQPGAPHASVRPLRRTLIGVQTRRAPYSPAAAIDLQTRAPSPIPPWFAARGCESPAAGGASSRCDAQPAQSAGTDSASAESTPGHRTAGPPGRDWKGLFCRFHTNKNWSNSFPLTRYKKLTRYLIKYDLKNRSENGIVIFQLRSSVTRWTHTLGWGKTIQTIKVLSTMCRFAKFGTCTSSQTAWGSMQGGIFEHYLDNNDENYNRKNALKKS